MREKASILIQIQIGTRIGSKFRQISESGSKSNISGSTTLFSMVYTLFYEHSLSYFTYQAFHKLPKSINQKHFEQNKQIFTVNFTLKKLNNITKREMVILRIFLTKTIMNIPGVSPQRSFCWQYAPPIEKMHLLNRVEATSKQCCGAGATRSRDFLAAAGHLKKILFSLY